MLRQGPVDKNDGKPCETWELTRRSATHWHKAMSITKNFKPRSRVEVKVNFRQNEIIIVRWLVFQFFSSCQVSEHPPRSHFSSCFHPVAMTLLERCTGLTPEHLSNSTKVSKFHFTSPFRGLEPQTPVPSTRPLLLPCQSHWMSSWCPSHFCWLSMLRQGPVDKNDGKACQIWELTRRSATLP